MTHRRNISFLWVYSLGTFTIFLGLLQYFWDSMIIGVIKMCFSLFNYLNIVVCWLLLAILCCKGLFNIVLVDFSCFLLIKWTWCLGKMEYLQMIKSIMVFFRKVKFWNNKIKIIVTKCHLLSGTTFNSCSTLHLNSYSSKNFCIQFNHFKLSFS